MLLSYREAMENVSPVADTIDVTRAQTEVSHPSALPRRLDGRGQTPRNVAIRLTGRSGKWIPNGGRHCERRGRTISLVMETACRGNAAATGERKIHSQRREGRVGFQSGKVEGALNGSERDRKREGERGGARGEESSYVSSPPAPVCFSSIL